MTYGFRNFGRPSNFDAVNSTTNAQGPCHRSMIRVVQRLLGQRRP
jgi:hypothetical protein